jgi:hypothetical protein
METAMFVKLSSYSISNDGHIERRRSELPAVVNPSPVTVRVLDSTDKREAIRLLQHFIDEFENQPHRRPAK